MNLKLHFLMTALALVFLGVIAARPEVLYKLQNDQRVCTLNKGKPDCITKHVEYKINSISEVPYTIN